MASSDNSIPTQAGQEAGVNRLHTGVLGLPAILFVCIAAIAPAASMLFNVPVMASQAGAATPLAFVLSAIGVLLLGVSVVASGAASRLRLQSGYAICRECWQCAASGAASRLRLQRIARPIIAARQRCGMRIGFLPSFSE
jgi:hypothetical protein